jgi:long-chain acyl-CoA synthetase
VRIALSLNIGEHDGMRDSPTILDYFHKSVDRHPSAHALGFIRNGELRWLTWQEIADRAHTLAAMLRIAGIAPGDRVAQVSENRHEWIITDLATHIAGAVHVPVHTTLSAEQIAEQVTDSGAKLVFISTRELLNKLAGRLPRDIAIKIHDDTPGIRQAPAPPGFSYPVPCPPSPESSLATILYTSGTTGRPRGVMLSHQNLASNAAAVCEAHTVGYEHTMLCILPLSHIYARTCDLYTWIVRGCRLVLAESRETFLRDCQIAQPTDVNSVPFVYQRVMDGILASSAADKPAALRAAFGGRVESLFCGGAPVAPDVERWYSDQGLPLFAGYGLTESSPVIAANTWSAHRPGTVGRAIPGIEIRTAPDGELLTRGPHVMLGYRDDETATLDAIRDGWLHTGDLAEIDADGFVTIRGRKKELIVLSTGKKVVPTRVESLLTASPHIDQAAVFGDGHCGLIALIVPSQTVPSACDLAKPISDDHRALYAAEIERCLASSAHEEQVHHFILLDRPFSIDRGEMTAKLSLCRTVIAQSFAQEIKTISPRRHGEHGA